MLYVINCADGIRRYYQQRTDHKLYQITSDLFYDLLNMYEENGITVNVKESLAA